MHRGAQRMVFCADLGSDSAWFEGPSWWRFGLVAAAASQRSTVATAAPSDNVPVATPPHHPP